MKKFALLLATITIGLAGCTTVTSAGVPSDISGDGTSIDTNGDYVLNGETLSNTEAMLVDVMHEEFPTSAELRDTCDGIQAYPETAWIAFNRGAEGSFTRTEFENAVNYVCS